MNRNSLIAVPIAATMLCGATIAFGHPGHTEGFAAGVGHPLTGVDHLLAALTVGLLAGQIGGRMRWMLPGAFVVFAAVGGLLATGTSTIPMLEQSIAASLLVLGLLCAVAVRLPAIVPIGLTALFAIFHGYAHVSEGSGAGFAIGALLSTAALHGVGLLPAAAAGSIRQRGLVRIAGAAVACAGVLMLAGGL